MKANITKTLISNENREFKIGNDICFNLNRNNKTYHCFGVITDIKESEFEICNVQIDKMNISDNLNINFSEVQDGILHLTDQAWY